GRAAMHVRVNRLMDEPLRLRKFLTDDALQPHARWRRIALEQKCQSLPLVRRGLLRKLSQRRHRFDLRSENARLLESPCAIRIVKIENRSLRPAIRSAIAVR